VEASFPRREPGPSLVREVPVRVLIVDDAETYRRAARAVVEATNDFLVAGEASDGESSIELARRLSPDLVLMDVHLPGMSGSDATRQIVADAPGTVVLLLSARSRDEAEDPASCGAAAFLPKAGLTPSVLSETWTATR
jgi:two-component system invasion response regulator UvrY